MELALTQVGRARPAAIGETAMSAITTTISFAGIYLAVAGGVLWKLGRWVLSDDIRGIPAGGWLDVHPDQACLVGVVLLLSAVGLWLATRQ
jgi:uncharacterized membrane protein YfcA